MPVASATGQPGCGGMTATSVMASSAALADLVDHVPQQAVDGVARGGLGEGELLLAAVPLPLPCAVRLGHGTSTAPIPRAGAASSANVSMRCRSPWDRARSPAPTSVTIAWTSPARISNCSPVGST
jgi:hypothetical protein